MADFIPDNPSGSTPLDPNELASLIPDYISTQGELNKLERDNISEAVQWVHANNNKDILTSSFVYQLHKKMFNQVWKWAGQRRRSDKNIGVHHNLIDESLLNLLKDVRYWIENETYPFEEIAVRFHHRLVSIHPFPNGNGRHARLITDLLLTRNGKEPFTWGLNSPNASLEAEGPLRDKYISALKKADDHNFEPLKKFVRT